jgi:hypothetical protein
MSRVKPSFWLFLNNKSANAHILWLLLLSGPIIVSVAAWLILSGTSQIVFYILLAYILALILIILFVAIEFLLQWRNFHDTIRIFSSGVETPGKVIDVHFFRSRGYITSEYEYQQEKYRSTDSIIQNQKTKSITVGQQVVVYVNQQKPTQAFIRDLYLNTF